MNPLAPAHLERAKRLLAYEGEAVRADESDTAAVRVYEKLHAHLAPLLGDAGLQMLFVRSAKLVQFDVAGVAGISILEGSTKLRRALQAHDTTVARELAAAMFGTFFALITTLIGVRLTTQVLRTAWPTIEETAPTETDK